MTAPRSPDEVCPEDAARLLGLPLHRLRALVQQGHVAQPVRGRLGLIAAACGHVAALRADARNLPTTAERRAAGQRDDTGRRAILDAEDKALRDLDRMARGASPERAAAIHAAQARIRAARVEAIARLHDA
jgi:hypothetical protein